MPYVVHTESPEQTRELAQKLGGMVGDGDLIVLSGDLGAGKTCFTQGLAKGLGIDDRVTSPTFTLHNRYEGRLVLNHLDVYRLDDIAETLDLDLPELMESGVTVIEWGEQVEAVLPGDRLGIRLTLGAGDDDRNIELDGVGSDWDERLAKLAEAES